MEAHFWVFGKHASDRRQSARKDRRSPKALPHRTSNCSFAISALADRQSAARTSIPAFRPYLLAWLGAIAQNCFVFANRQCLPYLTRIFKPGCEGKIPKGFRPKPRVVEGATLGPRRRGDSTLKGCASISAQRTARQRHNPFSFQGWHCLARLPRVARSSQPWAEGRNPFGIEDACKVQSLAGALRINSAQRPLYRAEQRFRLVRLFEECNCA